MIDVEDDLEEIFDTADFSVSAVFATTPPITVLGNFREGSDAADAFGVEVEAVEPTFTCRTSQVVTVRQKTSVTIGARSFTVERTQKIGTGLTVLYLKTA